MSTHGLNGINSIVCFQDKNLIAVDNEFRRRAILLQLIHSAKCYLLSVRRGRKLGGLTTAKVLFTLFPSSDLCVGGEELSKEFLPEIVVHRPWIMIPQSAEIEVVNAAGHVFLVAGVGLPLLCEFYFPDPLDASVSELAGRNYSQRVSRRPRQFRIILAVCEKKLVFDGKALTNSTRSFHEDVPCRR